MMRRRVSHGALATSSCSEPGCTPGSPHTSTPALGLLDVLHTSLLDALLTHLLASNTKASFHCPSSTSTVAAAAELRRACKALRDAFDAAATRVVLGGRQAPSGVQPPGALSSLHTLSGFPNHTPSHAGTSARLQLRLDTAAPSSPNTFTSSSSSSSSSSRGAGHASTHRPSAPCNSQQALDWATVLLRRTTHITTLVVQPWAGVSWSAALDTTCARSLTTLVLRDRTDLTDAEHIAAACPRLSHLDMSGCSALNCIAGLQPLQRSLKTLDIRSCIGLPSAEFQSLAALTSLAHLVLSGCPGLERLECVAGLTNLCYLDISHCPRLHSLRGAHALPSLTELNAAACLRVTDLSPLAPPPGCTSPPPPLRRLDLWGCAGVSDLMPLASLSHPGLTCLVLSGCCRVTDLSPLAACTSLVQLSIGELNALDTLQPLQGLRDLAVLEMGGCWGITSLEPLAACGALTHLSMQRCRPGLSGGEALSGLSQLSITK